MTWICRLLLQLMGWKTSGFEQMHHLKKYIIIVAPHTSNWDFPLGLLVRKACRLDKVKYLGKSSLFRFPLGIIFRALGGYPVERNRSTNLVQSYVNIFNAHDNFAIVMAPKEQERKLNTSKQVFTLSPKELVSQLFPANLTLAPTKLNSFHHLSHQRMRKRTWTIWSPYLRELREK